MPHAADPQQAAQSAYRPSVQWILFLAAMCLLAGAMCAGLLHTITIIRYDFAASWPVYAGAFLFGIAVTALSIALAETNQAEACSEQRIKRRQTEQRYRNAGFTPQQSWLLADLDIRQHERRHFP